MTVGNERLALNITLKRLEAIQYRSERRNALSSRPHLNALVFTDALLGNGEELRGIGEVPFRGAKSGGPTDDSWDFLVQVVTGLEGQRFSFASRGSALDEIEAILTQLRRDAERFSQTLRRKGLSEDSRGFKRRIAEALGVVDQVQPYSGVIFGIETMLLDLAAKALDIPVVELLGGTARNITVMPIVDIPTMPTEDATKVMLEVAGRTSVSAPLWLMSQGHLKKDAVAAWDEEIRDAVASGEERSSVIIHQPTHPAQWSYPRDRAGSNVNLVAVQNQRSLGMSLRNRRRSEDVVIEPVSAGGVLAAKRLISRTTTNGGKLFLSSVSEGGEFIDSVLYALAQSSKNVDGVAISTPMDELGGASVAGLGLGVRWEKLVDRLFNRLEVPAAPADPSEPAMNVYREVPFMRPLGPNGTKGHLLERQALARGLSTVRYDKGAFFASDGENEPVIFKWSRSPLSSAASLAMCTHKEATRIRLSRAGVPVPRGRTFRNGDFDTAREFAELIGYPVVVKPAMGVRGIGVTAGIQNPDELNMAFEQLSDSQLGAQDFIVEKHIHGKDYRIVVIGDEVVAAILREPASVTGDGERTVGELLTAKNAVRRNNPHLWGRPIMYDAAAQYQLGRVGMDLESVPEKGQLVLLSNTSSLSQGGDSTDVLDELHPSILEACVASVKAIPDLAFCGVDFLLEDHTKPLDEQEAGVCELNAHAAIGNCEYPFYGKPREVARTMMDQTIKVHGLKAWDEPAEELSMRLTVRGRVTGLKYRVWILRMARRFGLTGWIRQVNNRQMEIVIHGETAASTALAAAAVLGPRGSHPTSVKTVHVSKPKTKTFSIVRRAPEELSSV